MKFINEFLEHDQRPGGIIATVQSDPTSTPRNWMCTCTFTVACTFSRNCPPPTHAGAKSCFEPEVGFGLEFEPDSEYVSGLNLNPI